MLDRDDQAKCRGQTRLSDGGGERRGVATRVPHLDEIGGPDHRDVRYGRVTENDGDVRLRSLVTGGKVAGPEARARRHRHPRTGLFPEARREVVGVPDEPGGDL